MTTTLHPATGPDHQNTVSRFGRFGRTSSGRRRMLRSSVSDGHPRRSCVEPSSIQEGDTRPMSASCSNAEALRTKLATSDAPAGEWWEWEPVGRCLFAPADQLLLCGERGLYGDGTATQSKKDGVQANPCHGAGASDGCRFGHLTSVNTAYPSRAAKSSPFVRGALSGNFSADVSASTARTAVFTWWSSLMRNRGPDR